MTKTNEIANPINPPREHSKLDRLVTLLETGNGASLEEMTEATAWQSHTVRAAMTGLRRRGFTIERVVEGTMPVWSIKAPQA